MVDGRFGSPGFLEQVGQIEVRLAMRPVLLESGLVGHAGRLALAPVVVGRTEVAVRVGQARIELERAPVGLDRLRQRPVPHVELAAALEPLERTQRRRGRGAGQLGHRSRHSEVVAEVEQQLAIRIEQRTRMPHHQAFLRAVPQAQRPEWPIELRPALAHPLDAAPDASHRDAPIQQRDERTQAQ